MNCSSVSFIICNHAELLLLSLIMLSLMQPRIKFRKLIFKKPWLLGIKQALVVFSLSLISAALCCCISALSHTILFLFSWTAYPPRARTRLHLTDCVPLPKKQATSLSGIKTPAGAHWSAALCHRLPDLSSVLSSRPLNNKCSNYCWSFWISEPGSLAGAIGGAR